MLKVSNISFTGYCSDNIPLQQESLEQGIQQKEDLINHNIYPSTWAKKPPKENALEIINRNIEGFKKNIERLTNLSRRIQEAGLEEDVVDEIADYFHGLICKEPFCDLSYNKGVNLEREGYIEKAIDFITSLSKKSGLTIQRMK